MLVLTNLLGWMSLDGRDNVLVVVQQNTSLGSKRDES